MENSKKIFLGFAWVSFICGICSWIFIFFVPFGMEIAAIILGIIALIGLGKGRKKGRRIAKFGLWIGIAKLCFIFAWFAWVFIAFMINPVAH